MVIIIIELNQKMSVLSQKLKEATTLFQNHSFKQSLDAYQQCLDFCHQTEEAQSIVYNILSTRATLQYILGNYDASLTTLNSVLKKDPHHFLSLLRRSQVYKKKNKLKRALKDLETIYVFCPDNLQISAFKVEIEHLLLKQQREHQISSQSQQAQEEDEQAQLNFANLRLIDRKSIDNSKLKGRKSRVTILGDTTFEYRLEEQENQNKQQENTQDRAIRTYKQIELDDESQNQSIPIITIKAPRRGKSILKNKGTSIFIQEENQESRRSKYLSRQSRLLALVRNIDGKIIPSAQSEHTSNPSIKQVQFRKSACEQTNPNLLLLTSTDNRSTTSSRLRKSCLKMPSFQIPDIRILPLRLSKFQSIDSSKIDGHLISNPKRKSIEKNQLFVSSGQVDLVKSDSDSDNEGDEHNIFGSKQFVLSQDMKQQLGFTEEYSVSHQNHQVPKLKAKKSILKRNSSMVMHPLNKQMSCLQSPQMLLSTLSIKSKKSVMFNCTM